MLEHLQPTLYSFNFLLHFGGSNSVLQIWSIKTKIEDPVNPVLKYKKKVLNLKEKLDNDWSLYEY
jgi:hypothetical protein